MELTFLDWLSLLSLNRETTSCRAAVSESLKRYHNNVRFFVEDWNGLDCGQVEELLSRMIELCELFVGVPSKLDQRRLIANWSLWRWARDTGLTWSVKV